MKMMHNKGKIQKIRHFDGILVLMFLFIKLGLSGAINECYVEDNVTLICNYIPKALPKQFDHVRIVDFKRQNQNISLNSSSFAEESWEKVQIIEFNDTKGDDYSLTFSQECFQGLRHLKELKIHISSFEIDTDAFVGLQLVHTLDVSKCYRLVIQDIGRTLKRKSALPQLKNLIMSEIGVYYGWANNVSKTIVDSLLPRNITTIDLSRTQITFINVTAVFQVLQTLKNINLSYSIIGDIWTEDLIQKDLMNVKVVDISHIVLPSKVMPVIPGKYTISNSTGKYSDLTMFLKTAIKNILTPSILIGSNIIPESVSAWVYNYTVIFDEPLDWKFKQLIARKNNVKYLDIYGICPVYKVTSVQLVDLSENGLEMIHSLMCLPNLEIIDLSVNQLYKMQRKSPSMFERLFSSLRNLREINLSKNQLQKMPRNMFKLNRNVEVIDVSFNRLRQLHFDLMNLHNLRILDVRNNLIKILDEVSINNLNGIPNSNDGNDYCSVIMTSNPLLCSTCSCQSSIKWLLHSKLVNIEQQDLLCITEDETLVNVDESVAKRIQVICNRKIVIIVSTVSTSAFVFIVCMIGSVIYRRRRKLRRKRNMENVISRFINGEGQYEFVAFLSYSSRDEEFVHDHVIDPLNENLKLMIGTDRNLICTGDQHLRPGFTVHDETYYCLDRVSVVIVVVSDNFCQSSYCQNEFDQACLQRKPIVLMMLGNVNEELMVPSLKRLYKRDVRILWKNENDVLVLTTTWGNICSSMLEKVQV